MGGIPLTKKPDNEISIPSLDLVTVTTMNHIVEVQHMTRKNSRNNIRKLDKDRYVELSTGEIKEFEHSDSRKDNYNSLRQTFKRLRYLINNNFVGQENELHITLTYAENMTDTKQLYLDFNKFMKRLKYKYKNDSSIDYLSVVEPQGRGAWHCHLLIRFNDLEKVFINNTDLRELWGLGFVTIKSLKDIDNIGAYLSAYLSDVELSEHTYMKAIDEKRDIVEKEVNGEKKRFIKGGRLHMYPPGMNLYRKSKGIEFPERQSIRFKDIKKVVGSLKPHYTQSYHIENDDFENTISFLQYNKKRNE